MPKDPTKLLQRILVLSILPFFILFLFVWRSIALKNAANTASGTTQSGQTFSGNTLGDKDADTIEITSSGETNAENLAAESSGSESSENTLSQIEDQLNLESTGTISDTPSSPNVQDSSLLESDATPSIAPEEPTAPASPAVDASAWTGSTGSGGSAYRMSEGKTYYFNKQSGFTFAMPNKYYYANFGSSSPATLRVGLKAGESPQDLTSADVVVYFYPNIAVGPLANSTAKSVTDTDADTLYMKVGSHSIAISGYSKDSTLTQTIIASVSVQSE